ncbi:MAG: hypothetical protein REJ23_09355 [Brevundimonas sp.]|nr:hypothetical protein [Brevundimonas sp.]
MSSRLPSPLFWWITLPLLALAGVLMAQVIRVGWALARSPVPPAPVVEPGGQLSPARMGFAILTGNDLATFLGGSLAVGLLLGAVWAAGRWSLRRSRRRPS